MAHAATIKTAPPRGLLPGADDGSAPIEFHHCRYEAPPSLSFWIEHFWSVSWRMAPSAVGQKSTLAHPSIHLWWGRTDTAAPALHVTGVCRGRFVWTLRDSGFVFAAKFHPGAFQAWCGGDVSRFTDRVVLLRDVVGAEVADAGAALLQQSPDDDARVLNLSAFLQTQLQARPADQDLLMRLVDTARSDRSLTSVDELCRRFSLSPRALQRLCKQRLGISPKWLIQRYRLHDAVMALDAQAFNTRDSLAGIAADLGYVDQAHFGRDFKSVVGLTPATYIKRLRNHQATNA